MKLAQKVDFSKPFIIAEMSANHSRDFNLAKEIIHAAAEAGADAIKFQTYTADTMTLKSDRSEFLISDPNSPWFGSQLYDLYTKGSLPWEWHGPLFEYAKEKNIIPFSTPFDETALEYLEILDPPLYKIASFENNYIPLIQKVSETGKPIIVSTGMATLGEISEAVNAATIKNNELVLLKCTSAYPAATTDSNLASISTLKSIFNCRVGLSDHTLGIGAAIASVALGATVIEKHFTLSKKSGGLDDMFSLEPKELSQLVQEVHAAFKAIGSPRFEQSLSEKNSIKFRRSIIVAKDIKSDEILTEDNIKILRPGYGLPPKYYNTLLGKKVPKALPAGTPLQWKHILKDSVLCNKESAN